MERREKGRKGMGGERSVQGREGVAWNGERNGTKGEGVRRCDGIHGGKDES